MTDNTPSTCPRNEEAVGYALHSLEPEEEMDVLNHLPTCASCQQVAGDAEEVFARLGAAVEQVEPPPALRDRLLARVADTPQVPAPRAPLTAQSPAVVDPAAATTPLTPATAAPTTDPLPRQDGPRARPPDTRPADTRPGRGPGWSRRARRVLAGALALVAVLAIGGLAVRNAQLEQQRDAQLAQTQNLENLLDQLDRPGVPRALLAREDGSTVAAVVVENGRPRVYPIAVPANAADKDIYVLWGIPQGSTSPQPLGTFDVTGNGQAPVDVGAAGGGDFAAYAISLEPGRTAPTAPTAVVASGAVSA